MTHDETNSEFTISRIDDLSKIGSYTIGVKSEISIPDDATGTTFSTMTAEYDLVVYV